MISAVVTEDDNAVDGGNVGDGPDEFGGNNDGSESKNEVIDLDDIIGGKSKGELNKACDDAVTGVEVLKGKPSK